VARLRTTKQLAQRVDLNYFKRLTAYKRTLVWLTVLVPLLAVGWIAWRGFTRDSRVYSSGRMSRAHAVLEQQCAACHVQKAGEFSSKAADSACLACHDGPVHHVLAGMPAPDCASCHLEHRGRVSISAVSDRVCAKCHADLKTQTGVSAAGPTFHETRIHSFETDHPEFAAVQHLEDYPPHDPGTIKVNHAVHLKPIRRGPNGPDVQLTCRDCHRLQAEAGVVYSENASPFVPRTNWTYADTQYLSAKPSYAEHDPSFPVPARVLPAYKPPTGRELMAPVSFAKACSGCHSLAFDKRFAEGVPHDKPEVVHEFLIAKFQQYIAMHPGEVQVFRDPNRELTEKPLPPAFRTLTAAQWVEERTAEAEELLWRKTCKQCHELRFPATNSTTKVGMPAGSESHGPPASTKELPQIERDYRRFLLTRMPRAKFDHDAHRSFTCVSCHSKALTSTESSDILLPGIVTCKVCHAPGPEHAESRCFECHTYHDWARRKEMKATFTMPGLDKAGR